MFTTSVKDPELAKFWLTILSALRQHRAESILVLCADGLTGPSEAGEAASARAIFQTYIVHIASSSTRLVPPKERNPLSRNPIQPFPGTL